MVGVLAKEQFEVEGHGSFAVDCHVALRREDSGANVNQYSGRCARM